MDPSIYDPRLPNSFEEAVAKLPSAPRREEQQDAAATASSRNAAAAVILASAVQRNSSGKEDDASHLLRPQNAHHTTAQLEFAASLMSSEDGGTSLFERRGVLSKQHEKK